MRETCVGSQPWHTLHDVARGHPARYTANYRVADPMLWGRHTGCAFVQDKCIDAAGAPVDDRHFCNTLYWASDLRCTVDRMSFAYAPAGGILTYSISSRCVCGGSACDLVDVHGSSIAAPFRYFDNPSWGGYYTRPNYCPKYWIFQSSHECRFESDEPANNAKGERYCCPTLQQCPSYVDAGGKFPFRRYCETCRCFESTLGSTSQSVGCYDHVCHLNGSVTISTSSGESVLCAPADASTAKPVHGMSGAIVCPNVTTVCPSPSCFDGMLNGDEQAIDCGGSCSEFCDPACVDDADTDGDGVVNCNDECPNDPNKTSPGMCGCHIPDIDTDGDAMVDCLDECPRDVAKVAPGVCGCGNPDTDSDGDTVPNCVDECPDDEHKQLSGLCGCGASDVDTDGDSVPDCHDGCPGDSTKTTGGTCGCGIPDSDSDGDTVPNCVDNCAHAPNVNQTDGNGDGVGDVCDFTSRFGASPCPAEYVWFSGVCYTVQAAATEVDIPHCALGAELTSVHSFQHQHMVDALCSLSQPNGSTTPPMCRIGLSITECGVQWTDGSAVDFPRPTNASPPWPDRLGDDTSVPGTSPNETLCAAVNTTGWWLPVNCSLPMRSICALTGTTELTPIGNTSVRVNIGLGEAYTELGASVHSTYAGTVVVDPPVWVPDPGNHTPSVGTYVLTYAATSPMGRPVSTQRTVVVVNDTCPSDATKTSAGVCGCGVSDVDTDGDGSADCVDHCPHNASKVAPGVCGCNQGDHDTDYDGVADCVDACPRDANKTLAGFCGCNVAETMHAGQIVCGHFAQDCLWSAWSNWSACSQLCGGGTRNRTRTISVVASGIGVNCSGGSFEQSGCNSQACESRFRNTSCLMHCDSQHRAMFAVPRRLFSRPLRTGGLVGVVSLFRRGTVHLRVAHTITAVCGGGVTGMLIYPPLGRHRAMQWTTRAVVL